jgi:bifunctional oligoribonuclease and PAP phosphatase NrnA
MPDQLQETIRQRLQLSERIMLIAHVRPDGDAIGSLLGLGNALIKAGKKVQMVLADGVPASFRHLPGSQLVQHQVEGDVDLRIVLDCSDLNRIGPAAATLTPIDLNIDHHITNLNYASINLVEPKAVATSAILADHMPEWGLETDIDVASALLSGIIADTIGFRTSNMTPAALRLAADLFETGVDLPDLYNRALNRRSYAAARYWGQGLGHLQRDNGLVWTILTLEDRLAAGYAGNDDADLVNILTSIDDSQVAVVFIEQREDRVKVSWRSQPGIDVSQIALQFGGGGHPAAAGVEIKGSLETVVELVLQATRKLFGPVIETT